MEDYRFVLDKIRENNTDMKKEGIRRVLILHKQQQFFIGDACIRFDNFKFCRNFYDTAVIDLCFDCNDKNASFYRALLKNNPYLDNIFDLEWGSIDFENYDVVICAVPDEQAILDIVMKRFQEPILNGKMKTAIFSLSDIFVYKVHRSANVFPVYDELIRSSVIAPVSRLAELYISKEERNSANEWLENKGVKKDELLLIFLDSTSKKDKLLKINVYFEILIAHLNKEKVKALIFDESGFGKEEFYKEWLGETLASKLVFSKRMSFRNDLCLLSSDYTKMIFGPCTGLLHCASSIYNNFVKHGMPVENVPLMIAYTGQYPLKESAFEWWGNSPLVNCLLLKNISGDTKLYSLDELPHNEKINYQNAVACKEYTSGMIIDFIRRKTLNPAR